MAKQRRDTGARLQPTLAREARHAQRLAREIERARRKARKAGWEFTAVTAEQLRKKAGRTNSPMIIWQSWSPVVAGGILSYAVSMTNPDPVTYSELYLHVFVGPANIVPDVGVALTAVDTRFPRLTGPLVVLYQGQSKTVSFSIPIPTGIQPSRYLGNGFLFKALYHEPAIYLDRCLFPFVVS